jgi:excinuclease ABC subunit A
MSVEKIVVVGARENNLKNITVEIPRDKLVVITGLSGSGKSSLAFDTIYAEGQRRYVESLSSYARQFLGQMDKPDVDHVEGLSPAISIDQKTASRNPRSTVGTVTEIYDYMRVLWARAGVPYVPGTDIPLERQSVDQMVDSILQLPAGTKLQVLGPIVRGRKGEYKKELQEIERAGYVRVRVDGRMYEVSDDIPMDRKKKHTIEVVVDRLVMKEGLDRRLTESCEAALKLGGGVMVITFELPPEFDRAASPLRPTDDSKNDEWMDAIFSEHYVSIEHNFQMPELEPRMFSFNSPFGACPDCSGLGTKTEFDPERIIPDDSKPLNDGAIVPFVYKSGETKEWWPDVLIGVGRACGFDATKPVREITFDDLDVIWNGLDQPVEVTMRYSKTVRTFKTKWEGVIAILRKKYEGTESEWVKQDLQQYMTVRPCPVCEGKKLKPEARCVRVGGKDISEVTEMSVANALVFFQGLEAKMTDRQKAIAERAVKEIVERLQFLHDVGLTYLNLSRTANTLAGGEAQRIRLATQIGSGLMGCLYVLDEPSIGLHQRDNERLIKTLIRLRDLGNTVLVVEHDEDTMRAADWLIDLGPAAGEHGGWVVNEGPLEEFLKRESPTSLYLNGIEKIEVPAARRQPKSPHPALA